MKGRIVGKAIVVGDNNPWPFLEKWIICIYGKIHVIRQRGCNERSEFGEITFSDPFPCDGLYEEKIELPEEVTEKVRKLLGEKS